MKDTVFKIASNIPLAKNIFKMILHGNTDEITKPGQFINIKLNEFYLRRPISVCDKTDDKLTIIYKVQGSGTEALSRMKAGEAIYALTGLGNGYDTQVSGGNPLLVGGGVGIPPLYWLAKKLIEEGKRVSVVLGFNTGSDVFYASEFEELGCDTTVVTVDGSVGKKGFVTDAMPQEYSYFYTCGPQAMLKAVYKFAATSGQFSFEERMGCGFGACMGCSCKTVTGYKRICKDGPVLKREEILWED